MCLIVHILHRKPKLPIEMEFRPADEEPTDKEPAAEGDSVEWDPQKLLEHAEMMTRLKEKIYEKAKVHEAKGRTSSTMTENIQIQRSSAQILWSY